MYKIMTDFYGQEKKIIDIIIEVQILQKSITCI